MLGERATHLIYSIIFSRFVRATLVFLIFLCHYLDGISKFYFPPFPSVGLKVIHFIFILLVSNFNMHNKLIHLSLFPFWSVHGLGNDSLQLPPSYFVLLSVILILYCFLVSQMSVYYHCFVHTVPFYGYPYVFSISLLTIVSWHLAPSFWLQFSSS